MEIQLQGHRMKELVVRLTVLYNELMSEITICKQMSIGQTSEK